MKGKKKVNYFNHESLFKKPRKNHDKKEDIREKIRATKNNLIKTVCILNKKKQKQTWKAQAPIIEHQTSKI